LIAGGAGFIGSAFVRQRLREDPQVHLTVLDQLTYAGSTENLGWQTLPASRRSRKPVEDRERRGD
jgi:dTDP-glucose 4,6-dehydratase